MTLIALSSCCRLTISTRYFSWRTGLRIMPRVVEVTVCSGNCSVSAARVIFTGLGEILICPGTKFT